MMTVVSVGTQKDNSVCNSALLRVACNRNCCLASDVKTSTFVAQPLSILCVANK